MAHGKSPKLLTEQQNEPNKFNVTGLKITSALVVWFFFLGFVEFMLAHCNYAQWWISFCIRSNTSKLNLLLGKRGVKGKKESWQGVGHHSCRSVRWVPRGWRWSRAEDESWKPIGGVNFVSCGWAMEASPFWFTVRGFSMQNVLHIHLFTYYSKRL